MTRKPFRLTAHMRHRIAGIPCGVHILFYVPACPGRYCGPPDSRYPAEPAEYDYILLDHSGYPAQWLERKATKADHAEIEAALLSAIRAGTLTI